MLILLKPLSYYYSWTFMSFLFFPFSLFFFSRIKSVPTGAMKLTSKVILFLGVREPCYVMIPYYYYLGCRVTGKAWKPYLCFSLWCYVLYVSMPRCKAWLCIFKSIGTDQLFTYFLLTPFCPPQWQKQSDPPMVRETAFCSNRKWIGSISSNPWH